MRRRIVAAAVSCDYAELAKLADEHGRGLRFTFGSAPDVAAYWRDMEEAKGDPILGRLVRVLNMPYVKQGQLYLWPTAAREGATAKEFDALQGLYPEVQVRSMKKAKSYLGLRVGISPSGDWQLAVSGD
ncbi:hypothetical protein JGU66_14015 [Myxococcaceae bacterium JPH2]|nr:hypothetical protein [Myxococcaceae bacterium JPH2]